MKIKKTSSEQESSTHLVEEKGVKEKKGKKTESTGSRWTALIILVITIILSVIAILQGQLFSNDQSVNSDSSTADWQFSAE